MNNILHYHKTIGLLIIITLLSLLNVNNLTPDKVRLIPHADKIVHFIMYFTVTFVLLFEYYLFHKKNKAVLRFLPIITFAWGALIELSQMYLTNYRGGEWWDLASNTVGLIVAYLAFNLLKSKAWLEAIIIFPFKSKL